MINPNDEIIEYSISPNSGRIKKKIRYRKKRTFFSGRRMKKYLETGLLILLVIIFLASVYLILRPGNEEIRQMKYNSKQK